MKWITKVEFALSPYGHEMKIKHWGKFYHWRVFSPDGDLLDKSKSISHAAARACCRRTINKDLKKGNRTNGCISNT